MISTHKKHSLIRILYSFKNKVCNKKKYIRSIKKERIKTYKKEKGNQLKLQKRTVEMSLFIKIKLIPHCAIGSEEQEGNFAPPPDFGRKINCVPIRGTDCAHTSCPFPQFSNLPSALCKRFTISEEQLIVFQSGGRLCPH